MVRALGHTPSPSNSQAIAPFTPARATRTLPLVRRVVSDLLRLRNVIDQQKLQLDGFHQMGDPIDRQSYRDELDDVEKSLISEQEKWTRCVAELTAIGARLHSPFDGTVDFPALLHRRPIRLCWKPDDLVVEYWHEVGESSSDRKKVERGMFPAFAT